MLSKKLLQSIKKTAACVFRVQVGKLEEKNYPVMLANAYDTIVQDSLFEIFTVMTILNFRVLFQYLTHYTAITLDTAGRVYTSPSFSVALKVKISLFLIKHQNMKEQREVGYNSTHS